MRLLQLGDLHVHLTGPRAAECRRVLDHIALNAAETKPDVIIIAGDIYDRRSSPEERLYLAEFLTHLSAVAPVFAINGNHDDIDDVRLFRAEYGWNNLVEIITEPTTVYVADTGALCFLPWPNLANLAAAAGAGVSIALRREAAKTALLDIVRGFRAEVKPGTPSILIAHMPVTGASMDSGQPVSGGDEIALSADELLEGGAAGVALGHIHLRQQISSSDGRPVFYSGAPFRCNFGESKGMKGGLIWDWNGKSWDVTPWDVPARPMILIEQTWSDDLPENEDVESPLNAAELESLQKGHPFSESLLAEVKDAEVRLRVEFPTDARSAVRETAESWKSILMAAGAISVTIDERPIAISRTRCAEITAARTTADKLLAWAKAADLTVPDGSLVKLSALELEVRA